MSLSMNERAGAVVDGLLADADALGIEVRTLDSGARVVDCGVQARGGLQAGLGFAAACMGGLGRIDPVPVTVGERTWPGIGVGIDDPAAACLAAQYAGWKLEHEDFFAMASGPGRALARAEDLFEELAWREQADRAVLCLETRQDPPAEIVEKVAQTLWRSGVCGHVPDRADRLGVRLGADLGPRGRDRAAQAARARRRPRAGCATAGAAARSHPWPERSGGDRTHQRRGAVRRRPSTCGSRPPTRRSPTSPSGCPRRPRTRSARRSGSCSPPPTGTSTTSIRMLFSPAAVTLTSTESGRAHHGGGLAPEVLERSFTQ